MARAKMTSRPVALRAGFHLLGSTPRRRCRFGTSPGFLLTVTAAVLLSEPAADTYRAMSAEESRRCH
jgi:hypothetical protein